MKYSGGEALNQLITLIKSKFGELSKVATTGSYNDLKDLPSSDVANVATATYTFKDTAESDVLIPQDITISLVVDELNDTDEIEVYYAGLYLYEGTQYTIDKANKTITLLSFVRKQGEELLVLIKRFISSDATINSFTFSVDNQVTPTGTNAVSGQAIYNYLEEAKEGLSAISETTPTTLAGLLKGNGSSIGVAVPGTDYATASHTHTIDNIANLQSTLNDKAKASHTHNISEITSLQNTLNAKQAAPGTASALPSSGTALTANTVYHVTAAVTTYTFKAPSSGWAHGYFSTGSSAIVSFNGNFLGSAPTIEANKAYEFDVLDGIWVVQEVVTV